MRFRLFDWFLKDYEMNKHNNEYCLADLCSSLTKHVVILEERITTLEQKYEGALMDIKRLEEENVETTNCLYENYNSIDAVDARIDILAEHCGIIKDV
jgi:predicted ribosome quality control (RQC) complex YloA/Tae2 family protein